MSGRWYTDRGNLIAILVALAVAVSIIYFDGIR